MQDNAIQTFSDQRFGSLRVLERDGETWFVAKDVCAALEIGNSRQALTRLDDDEKGVISNDTPGGMQQLQCVNEPGLYALVLSSRKPEARAFKRWVTHEVLPSIRAKGGYMAAREGEDAQAVIARALVLAEDVLKRQEREIEEMRPKALFADAVAASDGTCLVGELAKMLTQAGFRVGQNGLFARLREDGYLIKGNRADRNMPRQKYVEMGLFKVKETVVVHADGHTTVNRTPKVTGKGQAYFMRRYAHAEGLGL